MTLSLTFLAGHVLHSGKNWFPEYLQSKKIKQKIEEYFKLQDIELVQLFHNEVGQVVLQSKAKLDKFKIMRYNISASADRLFLYIVSCLWHF